MMSILLHPHIWVYPLNSQRIEFDYGNGDSNWHIFQSASHNLIQISQGVIHHVEFWVVAPERPSTSQDVRIIYRPVNSCYDDWTQEVGERGIWTAEYARIWLIDKFIPQVYSFYRSQILAKHYSGNLMQKTLASFSYMQPNAYSEFLKRNLTDMKDESDIESLQSASKPEDFNGFLYDIQVWASCYPIHKIPAYLLKDYYAAFSELAAEIGFDFSEDHYVASNFLAIDSRLAKNNRPFFHVSGFELMEDQTFFASSMALYNRRNILDCLAWHADRITICDAKDHVIADWLSRNFMHIVDSENWARVSQERINKFKEALMPLWEHCRFERRYILFS